MSPGCVSDGQGIAEALANVREAIQCLIAIMEADGAEIPEDERLFAPATAEVEPAPEGAIAIVPRRQHRGAI